MTPSPSRSSDDALEDTHLTPEQMTAALVEPHVMDAAGARDVIDAIQHLTRGDGESYDDYIDRIKAAKGRCGELAREVKRAESQHNLRPISDEPGPNPRYVKALKTLAVKRQPIRQRGKAERYACRQLGKDASGEMQVEELNKAVVMARLEKLWDASVEAGDYESEVDWYQREHDRIWARAAQEGDRALHTGRHGRATSPQQEWRHEFKSGKRKGEIKFTNLNLAVHAYFSRGISERTRAEAD